MKINRVIIICFIAVFYAIICTYLVCGRTYSQPRKFDISSFFNGYKITFKPDLISYSVLVLCEQQPIVLSSFTMSQQAWFALKSSLVKSSEMGREKGDTNSQCNESQYIRFRLWGHLIHLYDIVENDKTGSVDIKCLIHLLL